MVGMISRIHKVFQEQNVLINKSSMNFNEDSSLARLAFATSSSMVSSLSLSPPAEGAGAGADFGAGFTLGSNGLLAGAIGVTGVAPTSKAFRISSATDCCIDPFFTISKIFVFA